MGLQLVKVTTTMHIPTIHHFVKVSDFIAISENNDSVTTLVQYTDRLFKKGNSKSKQIVASSNID